MEAESVAELCAHVAATGFQSDPDPQQPQATVDETGADPDETGAVGTAGVSRRSEFRIVVGGDDDRVPVTDPEQLQSFPLRSIGKIRAHQPSGSLAVTLESTGVLVGPRHVLTAAHAIFVELEALGGPSGFTNVVTDTESCGDGMGDIPCFEVTFSPGELDGGTRLNGEPRSVIGAFIDPSYLAGPNFNYDYAVLILEDEIETATLGWWELCAPSTAFFEQNSFDLIGYPGFPYTCEQSPHPEDLCAGFMYQHESCSVTEAYSLLLFHACDAQSGQSGAPISIGCRVEQPCVVGVHGGGGGGNNAARITPERISLITSEALCAFPSTHVADPRCP